MTHWSLADRVKLARLSAARGLRGLRAGAIMPLRLRARFAMRRPSRLLIAPQDIRTADPTIASDIYGGYFALGGKAVQLRGQSPFEIEPPSPGWSRNLMGFGWLRHLRAADSPLTRANAKALVGDWLAFAQRGFAPGAGAAALEPRVAARRILSFLSHSPIILDDATLAFYRQFLSRIAKDAARLQAALSETLEGDARILAALALAEVSLCVEGFERTQRRAGRQLNEELKRQILPDGGHVSRNPRLLAELLVDLLPLRQAYAARNAAPPPELPRAVAAMMPMLRMLRHGNGEIALFNGMGATAPDLLATVLAYEDGRAVTPMDAPQSGYHRRQAGDALLIVDAGRPPQGAFSEEAHAGALSFEFSSLLNRIVVNCGAPAQEGTPLRQVARSTAAHSTLVIGEESSARFMPAARGGAQWQRRLLSGPALVAPAPDHDGRGKTILADHDGYARRFGYRHRRLLALDAEGALLQGVDQLVSAGRKPRHPALDYALRFHLHPSVIATLSEDQSGVQLDLPGDESWYFSAAGFAPALEESIYLGAPHGSQRSQQIVLRANTADGAEISWSFQRYADAPEPEPEAEAEREPQAGAEPQPQGGQAAPAPGAAGG